MFERDVHRYLRALAGDRARRSGPFLIAVDEHDPGRFRNYAIPDDDARPTLAHLNEMITVFVEHDRTPRLEYLPGLCPAVEPVLVAAGFVPERRLPLMTCRPAKATARPRRGPVEVRLATSDEDLRHVAEAQNDAYGQGTTSDHDVVRLRSTISRGGLVGLAIDTDTGLGVGGGLCAPPHGGVSELAAIGVRAAYRRRGIATALTVLLTQACPAAGITTPFLTPAGEAEERIYHAAGYRPVSEILHISR